MQLTTFSLTALAAAGTSEAFGVWQPNRPRGWNWHSTHELSRGTADMPEKYDPNYNPPNPKYQETVIDTSGACSMNPFIFLAVIDSNYGDLAKFNMFGTRDPAGRLVSPNGQANDAMWMSLVNCAENKGVQKLMAIDALAKQRPDVIDAILDTSVDNTDGSSHQKIKDILFENPLEFYQNFWKYNRFIDVFENSGFSKWGKINALLKIVGDAESPAQRYRERTFLMQNLRTEPFDFGSRSTYLPAFQQNRAPWNKHNFMASNWNRQAWFKPADASLGSQDGTESQKATPIEGAKFMPELEREEFLSEVEVALEAQDIE